MKLKTILIMLMTLLTFSTAFSMTKQSDGSVTMSATEAIELSNKIIFYQNEISKLSAYNASLQEQLDAALEYNEVLLSAPSELSVVDKLLWLTIGAGVIGIVYMCTNILSA